MANTRADITIFSNVWMDIYSTSGIPVGTALTMWNKGSYPAVFAISGTIPTDRRGVALYPEEIHPEGLSITMGEAGLWVFSERGTIISVHEF